MRAGGAGRHPSLHFGDQVRMTRHSQRYAFAAGLAATLVTAFAPVALRAQVVRLERAEARLEDAFSFVRGMRELRDGKLLVADYIEQRIVLVDLAAQTTRDLLTEGAGPADVRLPMGLVPHRADSTLVIDYGNNRLLVLSPDARAVRTIVVEQPGRLFVRGPDAGGAFLYAVPGWSEGSSALADDSVRIVRWVPGAEATQQVAVVQGTRMRKDRGPSMQPRIPTVGFGAQDAWVVASGGELVIVRNAPFHIEVRDRDGRVHAGPAYQTIARAVTQADRRRYVLEFSAGAPTSGRGPNGGMGRSEVPNAAEVSRLMSTTEYAEFFPPFDAASVLAAPGGRTWVKRSLEPSAPTRYDVFDITGTRVLEVELPPKRRVALVTARGVYVVADGEDGVQSIERYRLP